MLDESGTAEVTTVLERGELEMEGLVPWGSNYTFLVRVCHQSSELNAIYKPSQGERPLWDFARGTLCQRERAAYLVSEMLGWNLVPPTVLREGPHGWGSVQQFVEHDPNQHYLTFQGDYVEQVQRIALFDVLINNADRKSGHVLVGEKGHLWAIDHGVSFHRDYKLRSVIWEFAGEPIPPQMIVELKDYRQRLLDDRACYGQLSGLLNATEMEALQRRLDRLIGRALFPQPGPGRHYPWPLI